LKNVPRKLADYQPKAGAEKMTLVKRFVADENGATAIEYGLIAAGIALAIITVVNNLGTSLNDKFGSISSSLK
jgi:pilus assembly protein Flp/PilA